MKLLSISTDRKIFETGSAVALRQLEYAKNWEEVHIIVFTNKHFEEISLGDNIWVYPTRSKSRWFYPFDAIRLGRFIVRRRSITNITCQDPFLTAMAGVSLVKQFNIPLEIQIHTDIGSPNFTYSFSNKIQKMMAVSHLVKADTIRTVSNKIKSYLVDKLKIQELKITVKPIVVDIDKIKNTPITVDLHKKYPQLEKIVLVASRLEREKNIELAVNSWPLVVEKIPRAGLVIVGSGNEEMKLKRLVARLGISAAVIFEPWVDSTTLISYLKTADLFLVTSLFEGYGMTLVEANAAHCKTVSTDVGVAREVGARIVGDKPNMVAEAVVSELR